MEEDSQLSGFLSTTGFGRRLLATIEVTRPINDQHLLDPIAQQANEDPDQSADAPLADTGYGTGAQHAACEAHGTVALPPVQKNISETNGLDDSDGLTAISSRSRMPWRQRVALSDEERRRAISGALKRFSMRSREASVKEPMPVRAASRKPGKSWSAMAWMC